MLSQPTQCVDTGVWRGWRRPPSEPPVSRAAAGASSGRGLLPPNPRTGALSQRSGAPLWSPASSTRTRPSSASRRPSGSPPSGSGPTKPSAASERAGSPPCSASRTTRRPATWPAAASTRPRAGSWPSRRDASRRRRGLGATPNPAGKSAGKSGRRGRFSGGKGGVAPSPALRPKAESGSRSRAAETQRGQWVSTIAATERHEHKGAHKGGLSVCPPTSSPRATPATAGYSPNSGRSRAWPATPKRPGIPASCRRRLAGPPVGRGRGRPDRGGPGSRSRVPSVPSAAPPGPAHGPGPRRPVRPKVVYVPGAAPCGSGFPAVENVPPEVVEGFRRSRITLPAIIELHDYDGGAEHRACRSGDRRSRPCAPSGGGARRAYGPAARVPAEAGVPSRVRRYGVQASARSRNTEGLSSHSA